jgi:hypothetical protein
MARRTNTATPSTAWSSLVHEDLAGKQFVMTVRNGDVRIVFGPGSIRVLRPDAARELASVLYQAAERADAR